MTFHRGQRVEVYRRSTDESWEDYMDRFVGLHGIVTDPDTTKNDPDALIEVSLVISRRGERTVSRLSPVFGIRAPLEADHDPERRVS